MKKQRFKKASLKNHVRLAKIEEQKRIPHVPLIFSDAKLINSAFYKFPNLSTRVHDEFTTLSNFPTSYFMELINLHRRGSYV